MMEGQHRIEVTAVDHSKEITQKQKRNRMRKSRQFSKKNRIEEKTAEAPQIAVEQSASDGKHVDGNPESLPELPPQEGENRRHDDSSAISKSITLPGKTNTKRSKKKKLKPQVAKDLGEPMETPIQQTCPNDGDPEGNTTDPISDGTEPSALCVTTAKVETTNPSESQATRKQEKHPVTQHPAAEKAGPKPMGTIDTDSHELQNTKGDVTKIHKKKQRRNNRQLNKKQRAQQHVGINASIRALHVQVSQPMSTQCESAQTLNVINTSGVKKVRWLENVGVESIARESFSCVPYPEGSASLQQHRLEVQIKPKSVHQEPSHLNSFNPTLEHSYSTEVTTPFTVRSNPSFELSRQSSTHSRASLSDLQDLAAQTYLLRRPSSVTIPPCLDTSVRVTMNATDGDNGNKHCLDMSAAIQMVMEKYGAKKTITLSPSTDQGSYSHRTSGATNSPSCKPFLSSENTSASDQENYNNTTTKTVVAEHSFPSITTGSSKAHITHQVIETQITKKSLADDDTNNIMSDVFNSKAVTPVPLAVNFNPRNKPVKSRAREEKPAYIPPHLRSLMQAAAAESKQKYHGADIEKKSQDTSNHDVRTDGITKHKLRGGSKVDTPQFEFLPEQSLPGGSSGLKTLDPHCQDEATTTVPTTESSVKDVAQRLPKERSQEEIFVARATKPKAPRRVIRIEDLLPEHLRNLPKPILMGPQVKRNAELAAKQVHIDPEVVIAQIVKRNEDYYQPVLELEATGKLVQELAAGEETPDDNADLAEDCSSMCSEDSKNITAEMIAARRSGRWRWFNGKVPSETGHHEQTPLKELRHELVAWDGQWLTPPIEWNMRGQFNNNTRTHVQWMENWVLERVMEALNRPVKLELSNAGWLSGHTPASGTSKQWQIFPEDCVVDHVPLEYGPVDWSQAPTLPPNDPYSQTKERQNQTSLSSAKKFSRELYAEKFSVMKEKLARRVEHAQMKKYAEQSRQERAPKANIYIRPAQLSDVPQIKHLYNHYVLNTVHALELEATDDMEWQNRLQGAEDEHLAFLVAVLKAAKKYGRGARDVRRGERGRRCGFARRNGFVRPEDIQRDFASETIVGFAYAEDHAGKHTMFQHAVELQLFVDPNHYMNGIGKTLMDRMMTSLDKSYMMEATTDFVDDGKMCYEIGGARDVHKILVTVGFHFGDEKELEWRKSWLEQKWEFDHIGTMNCLGKKFGKGVNIAQFVKETNMIHGSSIWYKEEPDRMPHREIAIRARKLEEARLAKEQARLAKEENE